MSATAAFKTVKNPRRMGLRLRDLTVAIIKAYGVHEGTWRLYVAFGQPVGMNAAIGDPDIHLPAAVVPVTSVGIIEATEPDDMVVDAAEVNPRVVN